VTCELRCRVGAHGQGLADWGSFRVPRDVRRLCVEGRICVFHLCDSSGQPEPTRCRCVWHQAARESPSPHAVECPARQGSRASLSGSSRPAIDIGCALSCAWRKAVLGVGKTLMRRRHGRRERQKCVVLSFATAAGMVGESHQTSLHWVHGTVACLCRPRRQPCCSAFGAVTEACDRRATCSFDRTPLHLLASSRGTCAIRCRRQL
jgi:hypothetical protein